eukprot:2808597-Prymnesium_polylepis.1
MKLSKTAADMPVAVSYGGPGSLFNASSQNCSVHEWLITLCVRCAIAFHVNCGTRCSMKATDSAATSSGTTFCDRARKSPASTPSKRGLLFFASNRGGVSESSDRSCSKKETTCGLALVR